MIVCTVKVSGRTYSGLFASTTIAVIDAMSRFPHATRISARAG